MSERKINLEEILENHIDLNDLPVVHPIVSAMKEACKQLLELVAENAYITTKDEIDGILNTIKQVE